MAAGVKVTGLRSKVRVFEPQAFDPGQVVEFDGKRGVVWSLGCETGRSIDSRWVVVEDGGVELLVLDKTGRGSDQVLRAAFWRSWMRKVPTNAVPFSVSEFFEQAEQLAVAA